MALRYVAALGLRVRNFDDGAIVFDPLSWDSHILNPAAAAVLEMCQSEQPTRSDIAAFLEDALVPEARNDADSYAASVIEELSQLCLVRPIDDAIA